MATVIVNDIGSVSVRTQRPETARVKIGTGGGGVSELKRLIDVSMSGVQNGYVLVYKEDTNTFYFSPYIIDDGYF
jgi:ethanolamine utilization microcompartment shell protein EutL